MIVAVTDFKVYSDIELFDKVFIKFDVYNTL